MSWLRLIPLAFVGVLATEGLAPPALHSPGLPLNVRPAADTLDPAEGARIYETLCAGCHALGTPARTAPPLAHVAMRYRQAYPDRDEAVARLADYVRAPAAARSVLSPDLVQRWGVMPALPLPDEQLRAVALYVWSIPESALSMPPGQEPRGQRARPPRGGTRP